MRKQQINFRLSVETKKIIQLHLAKLNVVRIGQGLPPITFTAWAEETLLAAATK